MNLGCIDLDTNFEYLIVYKHKSDNTINTWTLGSAFKLNYKQMLKDDNVEILGVYKKLTESQLEDIINNQTEDSKMKKFRITYWFNSCITEFYVIAGSEQKALEKFKELRGEKKIIGIEVSK